MKVKFFSILWLAGMLFLTGCAGTLPTNSYIPQNYARVSGQTAMGEFKYKLYTDGIVKSNQIKNTALGSIFISTDVANFVKRGTALELEKSGIVITDNSPYSLYADIIDFTCDDIGYSVIWKYSITYKFIRNTDNVVVYSKNFTPEPKKTGKFGLPMDYANIVSEVILSGYDMFIRDPEIIQFLTAIKEKGLD